MQPTGNTRPALLKPPKEAMEAKESDKLWTKCTAALLDKDQVAAGAAKHELEEEQRDFEKGNEEQVEAKAVEEEVEELVGFVLLLNLILFICRPARSERAL